MRFPLRPKPARIRLMLGSLYLLATLVATPCTAPFMGSAVGFTLGQPAAVVLTVMGAVGVARDEQQAAAPVDGAALLGHQRRRAEKDRQTASGDVDRQDHVVHVVSARHRSMRTPLVSSHTAKDISPINAGRAITINIGPASRGASTSTKPLSM